MCVGVSIEIVMAYHNTASAKDYTSDECATTYKERNRSGFKNFNTKHAKKMIIYVPVQSETLRFFPSNPTSSASGNGMTRQ